MRTIYFLTDYKGYFGTKYHATPYRSGLDKTAISEAMKRRGFEVVFIAPESVNFRRLNARGQLVVYTSAEDERLLYKDYLEDVLLALHLQGAILVPRFEFFRAHHNKVFMEMLRDVKGSAAMKTVASRYYGTLEDLKQDSTIREGRFVVKPAAGAMSAGVALAENKMELLKTAERVSRSRRLLLDIRDYIRSKKRKGYRRDSWHRKKYIVQDFIPGLSHDWKVLIYGKKLFALRRDVRPSDFRASGSGRFTFREDVPRPLLDLGERLLEELDVPWLSLDVGISGDQFHVLEFQVVYFGTLTLERSEFFFRRSGSAWELVRAKSNLEEEYCEALCSFIVNHYPQS
jgi:glutathione synthase/RimK-type ligase-like ATP-grasp enzyme